MSTLLQEVSIPLGTLASFALLLPTSTEVRVYNLLQLSLGFSFFEHQP